MVAGDPLSTIPYVGTVGGMVIVSAGDPSCHTSPNEQDQRHLGPMLHLVILDPSTPQEACDMTRQAFELSEASRLPVLLRITARVAHSRAKVRCAPLGEPRVGGFVRDPARFVPMPANARRLRLEIKDRLATARRFTARLFRQTGGADGRRDAVLASGAPAATCADLLDELGLTERVILATLGGVHPLPEDELVAFLRRVDRVLVVEELSPFLEDAIAALCNRHGLSPQILGKRSGHFPEEFEYVPEIVRRGLHGALDLGPAPGDGTGDAPQVAPRPPVLCPGCPHRSTFFAVRSAFGDEHLYFNDIGCYTLGFGEPLETADALLCMGAGFSLAAGVSRVTGQRTVGFVGDSTFFHSGIPPLLNAIKEDVNMVAVILDNEVTAMTGFQESPAMPGNPASIEAVVRALGARHVETVDPADLPSAIAAFERARDATGVSVVVARHPCPVHTARQTGVAPHGSVRYEIDQDRCRVCGREGCGMRCSQCVMKPFERQLARGRALEVPEKLRAAAARDPVAPCSGRCPLGLCIQGYTAHVAAGQYREALELILDRASLPDSVCRVCHRPCEEVCVRRSTDEPVAINDLKRFVMDWAAFEDVPYEPACEAAHGRKVAVVGAGPAGLAAAHDLRLRGYEVTLFDAAAEPGGLLLSGIPPFRLPREAVRRDVERILGLGVDFVGGTVLGEDVRLAELLAGHDAVFLALGAPRPSSLRVPGSDGGGPELVDALGYLAGSSADGPFAGRVVVVGGGNAALDAARTARRRGAERVVVAYRRRRGEMPALAEEVEAAGAEGIELRAQVQPVAVRPEGLLCVRTEPGEDDASGRCRPVAVEGSEELIAAGRVIVAVGQSPGPAFLRPGDPELLSEDDGSLSVDPETARTSEPRIFAGGDVVRGPRTVTEAMAWGMRAAWGIDSALRGREAADRRMPPPRADEWPTWNSQRVTRADRAARQRPRELPDERRVAGFDEVVATLREEQAQAEASRCQVCGQCGNCRACLDLFGCPAFYLEDGEIRIDPALCNGCGVCAAFCPNGAILPVDAPQP